MLPSLRALAATDVPILWEMLRHAAHEPDVAAVQRQPELTRYVADWGRDGDLGWVAVVVDTPLERSGCAYGEGHTKATGMWATTFQNWCWR
jgi:hypothetical protein